MLQKSKGDGSNIHTFDTVYNALFILQIKFCSINCSYPNLAIKSIL